MYWSTFGAKIDAVDSFISVQTRFVGIKIFIYVEWTNKSKNFHVFCELKKSFRMAYNMAMNETNGGINYGYPVSGRAGGHCCEGGGY